MKRTVLIAAALLLVVGGCARTEQLEHPVYQDGVYTATTGEYDSGGWQDVVSVTVEGGQIIEAEWDAINKEGQSKKELSESGQYGMKAGGARSEWHEQAESLEAELIRQQDPAKIGVKENGKTDSVSGVSIAVDGFVELANQALSDAK